MNIAGVSVRNLYGECQTCGGPKTTEAKVQNFEPKAEQINNNLEPQKTFVSSGNYRSAPKYTTVNKTKSSLDSYELTKPRSYNMKPFLIGLAVVTVFLGLIGLMVFLFMPHEEHVRVTNINWTYQAFLQQRVTRNGSSWDDNMPIGAFDVSCDTRQRGTERCHPHDCNPHQQPYDCRPHECSCHTHCVDDENGYSSCTETCDTCYDTCYETAYDTCYDSCPVYDDWCNCSYYEWPTIHIETLSGNNHEMQEPALETNPNAPSPQRVVREHRFSVTFANEDGESWIYIPGTVADYNRFNTGERWLIEVNRAGSVVPERVDNN